MSSPAMTGEPGIPSPAVLVDRRGPDAAPGAVTVVRLNRPESRNALTVELKEALRDALEEVADDPTVRAVVLASSGPAFCVGQDLKEHAEALHGDMAGDAQRSGAGPSAGDAQRSGAGPSAAALSTVPEHYNRIASALATMPKPVVAAIDGTCVGAGLGFALACDLRVAAAGTRFATAFVGIGFGGDSGLSGTLAHAVGASRATELLMLGEPFTAEQAHDWGLVREVVPAGEVDDAAIALAERLAAGPTLAYAEIKRAVAMGTVSPLREVLEHEAVAQARLGATEDHRGAVDAFLAKEKPTFSGR